MKAALKDMVDALERQSDDAYCFLDRQTGQVEYVSREVLGIAEEKGSADDALEWQRHEFEVAEAIFADWDRFVKLPTKYDIDEWEIMREFAESAEPERFRADLERAIHGSGASGISRIRYDATDEKRNGTRTGRRRCARWLSTGARRTRSTEP